MSNPYFPGQKPSCCGHYYPDVLRLRDERKEDGTFVRILEVIYLFGNKGTGYIVADHVLGEEIVKLIVARAKLENRSRGVMEWTHGDKQYKITVVEYESFGASAFRLTFTKKGATM